MWGVHVRLEGVDFRLGGVDFRLEGGHLSLEVACEAGVLVIWLVVKKHLCLDIRRGIQPNTVIAHIYMCIYTYV